MGIMLASVTAVSENEKILKLEYFLLPEPVYRRSGELAYEEYGLTVVSTCDGTEERECIRAISPRVEFVKQIAEMMARNTVFPCTAKDVVEDLLCM